MVNLRDDEDEFQELRVRISGSCVGIHQSERFVIGNWGNQKRLKMTMLSNSSDQGHEIDGDDEVSESFIKVHRRLDTLEKGLKAFDRGLTTVIEGESQTNSEIQKLESKMLAIQSQLDILANSILQGDKQIGLGDMSTHTILPTTVHPFQVPSLTLEPHLNDIALGICESTVVNRSRDCLVNQVAIPLFVGVYPYAWIMEVEKLFRIGHVSEAEKLRLILVSLEGDALEWYTKEVVRGEFKDWREFKRRLLARFGQFKIPSLAETNLKKGSLQQDPGSRDKLIQTKQVGQVDKASPETDLMRKKESIGEENNSIVETGSFEMLDSGLNQDLQEKPVPIVAIDCLLQPPNIDNTGCEAIRVEQVYVVEAVHVEEVVPKIESPCVDEMFEKNGGNVPSLMHTCCFTNLVSSVERHLMPSILSLVIEETEHVKISSQFIGRTTNCFVMSENKDILKMRKKRKCSKSWNFKYKHKKQGSENADTKWIMQPNYECELLTIGMLIQVGEKSLLCKILVIQIDQKHFTLLLAQRTITLECQRSSTGLLRYEFAAVSTLYEKLKLKGSKDNAGIVKPMQKFSFHDVTMVLLCFQENMRKYSLGLQQHMCGDEKFYMKHKWKSKNLQTISIYKPWEGDNVSEGLFVVVKFQFSKGIIRIGEGFTR